MNNFSVTIRFFFSPLFCLSLSITVPVCKLASLTHLQLLDRSFNFINFLLPNLDMRPENRRIVEPLTLFSKITNKNEHPLHSAVPAKYVPGRQMHQSLQVNARAFQPIFFSTKQPFNPFMTKV